MPRLDPFKSPPPIDIEDNLEDIGAVGVNVPENRDRLPSGLSERYVDDLEVRDRERSEYLSKVLKLRKKDE